MLRLFAAELFTILLLIAIVGVIEIQSQQTVKYSFSTLRTGLSKPFAVSKSPSTDAVYMSEYDGHRVRKLSSDTGFTTIAGTGTMGWNGDILATNARLNRPGCILEFNNEVYIVDYGNNRLRKILPTGVFQTIAGNGERVTTGDSGLARDAKLNGPWCSYITSNGDIYITEYDGHRVRKITASNMRIQTIAGTGTSGFSGDGGSATAARLSNPWGVYVNSIGEVFIADTGNNRIRLITTDGNIKTICGSSSGSSGDNGPASSARLNKPTSLYISPGNELFISDADNGRIRKIDLSTMIITTFASSLNYPTFVFVAPNSDVYIADSNNNQIRKATAFCDTGYRINSDGTSCDPICNSNIGRDGCSNHGSCTSPGVCTCDSGWTSSDCSQPICYGRFGDVACGGSTRGVCSSPNNCTCVSGYFESDCGEYYCGGISRTSATVCSGVGSCTAPDTCSCQTGYTGSICQYPMCNGIASNSLNVCNGGGTCIAPNTCSCSTNYTGNQCQYTTCFGIENTNTSHVCSGKGDCVGYNKCTCSSNYYGNNCEFTECYGTISSSPQACSSHGKCSGFNKCICDFDYFGLDCSVTTCYGVWSNTSSVCTSNIRGQCLSYNNCTCNPSYYGNECQEFDCFGINKANGSVCSGNGICSNPNSCTCTNSNFSGANCNAPVCYGVSSTDARVCSGNRGECISSNNCSCYSNYFGNECQFTQCFGIDNSDTTNVCSGRGICSDFNKCNCNEGYYGSNCQISKCYGVLSNSSFTCSSHGTCLNLDTCSCDLHYSGPNCNITTCFEYQNTNPLACSSKGICSKYNNCTCSSAYFGQQCNEFNCYNVNRDSSSVCSGHGTCTDIDRCSCSENWYGDNCNLTTCYGIWNWNSSVCSGNGVCSSLNNCSCNLGYYGSNCDTFDCFGMVYTDKDICGNNGTCAGPGTCSCLDGFTGEKCQYPICYGVSGGSLLSCSGNGKCVDINTCSCNEGWLEKTCNTTICYGKRSDNSNVCNSHGSCIGPNICSCTNDYTGPNCEFNVCYGKSQNDSYSVCSGRGQCLRPNECTCNEGFRGTECQHYQLDFDEKQATLKPKLNRVFQYSTFFNGSCETLFETSDLSFIGESPICIWDISKMIIYLGYGANLETGTLLRVKNNDLSFYVNMSSASEYTGTGISLKKLMTNIPSTNPLPITPITDFSFQSFTNFKSLVWSCISCPSTLNDILKAQEREYLYIPSSYLKSESALYLQLTASNYASISKTASLSLTFSQMAAPNLDLITDLNINSRIVCTGYDCIVETEPIGFGNNGGMFLAYYPTIQNNVYLSRFFNSESGVLSSGTTNGNVLLLAKHSQSSSSQDFIYPYSYTAYDFKLPVVLSALNPIYSPSSFISFKANIFNPLVFIQTVQDTYYLWRLYKVDNFGGSQEMNRELYLYLYYSQVTVTRKLEPGTYIMTLDAVAAFGATSLNTTFTVLNTTESLPSISFVPLPTISPISNDLTVTAMINGTKSTIEWILQNGRIKPHCKLQISHTQQSENLTQSELFISKNCLYEGEVYRLKVIARNSSNGLFSSAEIQTQTDITPSIHCHFYSTSEDGLFIALDSSLLITCLKGAKDTIRTFIFEIHHNGIRKFVISNTLKKNLHFRMPYLIEGSQLVVRAVNVYDSEVVFRKNLTSSLPSSDRVQKFIEGYNSITTSETTSYFGIINSLNSLLSLFEYDQFDTITNKINLERPLKDMLTLISRLKSSGVNVEDKLSSLFLPSVYRIHKYLNSIDPTRSSDDWRVDDLQSWSSYFVESILKSLQYYYPTQWKFIIDEEHLSELKNLIELGSSMNSEKFVMVQIRYQQLISSMNGNKEVKSIISLSNGVLQREKLDSIEQLRSFGIELSFENTNVLIKFPYNISDTLTFGDENSDNSIDVFSKVSKSTNPKVIGILASVNIQTQKFKELSVQNLTNPINIAFTGAKLPSSNVTCKYYNDLKKDWQIDGVETVISKSNDLITISCMTNHLTTFAIFINEIPPTFTSTNTSNPIITKNNHAVAIALGIILPLLAILVIIIFIVVAVILLLRYRKKRLLSEVSSSQNIELRDENKKRGLFDTDISDFPSEESTYFKHLNSSSMASTLSSTSSNNDAFSKYKDMVKIGEGAFGSVFKVTEIRTNKTKAIKVVRYKSVEELNSMMKEGAQLMNINHPNILKVNDFFVEKDNLLCIDMDFYPQGDLSTLINQEEDCKEVHIKQIIFQMCTALNFIHNNLKLIHRDVKPSNIFIKILNGNVIHTVLADFGLAKDNKNSFSQSFAGTPLYMSPELALGGKYYSNTDEYSLGVTVYQLMTKDTMTAISHLYMSKEPKEVQSWCRKRLKESGDYSDRLIDICLEMIEKDNCKRPYAQDILENSYFNDIRKIR